MIQYLLIAVVGYVASIRDLTLEHEDLLLSDKNDLTYLQAYSLYEQFVSEYDKKKSDDRFTKFHQTLHEIRRHNSNPNKTYTQGINQYSDLSNEEFNKQFLIQEPQNCSATNTVSINLEKDNIPENWDWREHNGVSPVKNQGHCGSCWTFSTVGAMEAHYLIFYKKELYFSEQQLVDCAQEYDNHGCNGGLPSHAFEYIHDHGITTEEKYPYFATDRKCEYSPDMAEGFVLHGSYNFTAGDEVSVRDALSEYGPVSVAFQVVDGFRNYHSGVYTSDVCKNGPSDVNHAVLAVGYGHDDETNIDYYIVKNSWGTQWGDKGYFKIQRNVNMCGMAQCNSFPNLGQVETKNVKVSTESQ